MNLINLLPKPCLTISSMLAFTAMPLSAQVDATAWTSEDGTTIWARLDGMEGDRVVLTMRNRTFRVPVSRFAPKSLEKLDRMLGLPGGRSQQLATASRQRAVVARTVAGYVSSKTPARQATLPSPVLRLPDQPDFVEPSTPIAYRGDTSVCSGGDVALPEWSSNGSEESVDAGFGAVLPPKPETREIALTSEGGRIQLDGRNAVAPAGVPSVIATAVEAANRLQTKYYKWGGGRARLEDDGYDCSGSVSYVLIRAGLLRAPMNSGSFTRYGEPGPGRWITIHARPGHVFMSICGLRLDTSNDSGESGPRWCRSMCRASGFVMRHPAGF